MMKSENAWPAVIVGAGVAGCAAAIALARRGVRTLLLETQPAPGFQIGETLPPAARPLLGDLGVWDTFATSGHLPSWGTVCCWGSDEAVVQDFGLERNGSGWHLDRPLFNKGLRAAAIAAGVAVRSIEGVNKVTPRGEAGWMLATSAGTVSANWVVDASGRRSVVARMLGARRRAEDSLVARYACFSPSEPGLHDDSRTHIEAVSDGWWYSAPTPSGKRVTAFLTDADLLPDAEIEDLLVTTSHMAELLQGFAPCNGPQTTAAQSARLDPLMGPNWLAVGNAAMSFDPVSSQGMYSALSTGLRGGEAIAGSLAGDVEMIPAFQARLGKRWQNYLQARKARYQMESRWPDSVFWGRRRAAERLLVPA